MGPISGQKLGDSLCAFFQALVAAGSALKVAREALIQAQEVGQGPSFHSALD